MVGEVSLPTPLVILPLKNLASKTHDILGDMSHILYQEERMVDNPPAEKIDFLKTKNTEHALKTLFYNNYFSVVSPGLV